MTIVENHTLITGGVDTHLEFHVAAAVDANGGVLGVETFSTRGAGYAQLVAWLQRFGPIDRVGVEGTGSYGTGLSRHLRSEGIAVVEVDRPNRQARRRHGKSDTVDAIAAARAALSRTATGQAKHRDGNVEAIRVLMVARRSAVDERIKVLNQIRHLVLCAPEPIRARFHGLTPTSLLNQTSTLRPHDHGDVVDYTTLITLRELGRRAKNLHDENLRLNKLLRPLIRRTAPGLLDVYGVGYDTAAKLLVAAGDNPERLHSEAAWATHVRRRTDRSIIGQDQTASPQPGREPPSELGDLPHHADPPQLRPTHPRLLRTTISRGQNQRRDLPDPAPLHRTRGLQATPTPGLIRAIPRPGL